jgi:serine O-acetyltransferase
MSANFWRDVQADLVRISGHAASSDAVLAALTRRAYRPLFTLRQCQALSNSPSWRWLLPLAVLLHRAARHWAGLDLPWRTRIGPGARIDHGWGMVINAAAVIGSNVTLFHGVTLGQRDRIAEDGTRSTAAPVIEDEVWIGPHAVIVGGITVGRGSRIAAGAFVTQDVPAHSLVIGNPAQIVQQGVSPDVENPWNA